MKLISKEFVIDIVDNVNIYKLIATIEVNNKQYDITIDNNSNYSQDKYQFSTSEYENDDVDADILEQFENSNFYSELCDFAESQAIASDNDDEDDIIDKIDDNYKIYKEDDCYYNNYKLTIFKHKSEDDFILRVEKIEKNALEQSFYEISRDDFDEDSDEVNLKEFYEYDCRNQINCSSQIK